MDKRHFLETWYRRVWEHEDLSAIQEMFRPDMQAHGLVDATHIGPDEFTAFAEAVFQLVGSATVTIDRYLDSGDWVAAIFTMTALSRQSGRKVTFTGQTFAKIVDGALVESYNHIDSIGLFEQLGLLPENTFEICLMGVAVA